jgi:hypothetical protein
LLQAAVKKEAAWKDFENYLTRPFMLPNFSPFDTWENIHLQHSQRYMYQIAMDMLVIMATSVTIKQLFSRTGCFVGHHSTNMLSMTLVQHISVGVWHKQTEKEVPRTTNKINDTNK